MLTRIWKTVNMRFEGAKREEGFTEIICFHQLTKNELLGFATVFKFNSLKSPHTKTKTNQVSYFWDLHFSNVGGWHWKNWKTTTIHNHYFMREKTAGRQRTTRECFLKKGPWWNYSANLFGFLSFSLWFMKQVSVGWSKMSSLVLVITKLISLEWRISLNQQ